MTRYFSESSCYKFSVRGFDQNQDRNEKTINPFNKSTFVETSGPLNGTAA